MNKKTWYVFIIKDNEEKFYAFAKGISNSNNLVKYAKQAYTMNACDSKKEALRIAQDWNESFIQNGAVNKWLVRGTKEEAAS